VKYLKYYLLSIGVIGLDQLVKMLAYYEMHLKGISDIPVLGQLFRLHYTTNPGMAFGIELGSPYGKLVLTAFRLVAMLLIALYLRHLAKKNMPKGLLWSIALILGGAVGNVIDSTFYGVWFGDGLTVPGAQNPWFHGRVIDMFYLDVWEGRLPDWMPFWGGHYISLWPIFNIADASIFVGVAIILIWQRRFFAVPAQDEAQPEQPEQETPGQSAEVVESAPDVEGAQDPDTDKTPDTAV